MSVKTSQYRSILKSSSLIGGASLINVLIGMVKTKFVAVLLGPTGVGLMGTYVTIMSVVNTVSGMGLSSSGVRQIADAYGSGDEERVTRTIIAVRRTAWLTGLLGMAVMMAGSYWLSVWSFGNREHTIPLSFLGITILLAVITSGQSCLLQGARRIGDLAKVSIAGAANGALIGIPCFYFWGQKGIVPSLILSGAAALATSWWYARKVAVRRASISWRESFGEGRVLLRLGLPLMVSGVVGGVTSYFIRIVMLRQVGLDGVGIYQAAFNLSGLIVNFVLMAMVADYYPRLTAVSQDDQKVAFEVNAQTEIALLLAGPALVATLVFAPFAINFFYSGRFDAAIDILRWAVYGVFWRVVSWPMGFILLAKAKGGLFLATEIFAGGFHLLALWFCTARWGLAGTGIAYALVYAAYTALMVALFLVLTGSAWTRNVCLIICGLLGVLGVSGLVSAAGWPAWLTWPTNVALLSVLSGVCLYRLSCKTGISPQALLARLGVKLPALTKG